ncbi:hypothetical protein [Actomonas aquatica]|uniref:Uncharacterized protein n=1 Tax=Actomonas aquatica TaxID=2866162 RepID=A0ABZ1CCK5_9BACT|nr:hypothetical protein [Opitutus sp. WL0086]WRQ89047.1 hypothetical protein K1X11_006480 [Opitutus sp. WL0086]
MQEIDRIDNFDETGNSVDAWKQKAEELSFCAEGLQSHADSESSKVYDLQKQIILQMSSFWVKQMLRGFTLECLLKALWLKNGNSLCDQGRYNGLDGIKNHRIHEMAPKVGFQTNDTEKRVLRILGAFATSGGRYPVFTKYDSLSKDFGSGNPKFILEWNLQELEPAYFELRRKLVNEIEE